MLEAIGSNTDPSLFGSACVETADRVPPSILWEAPPDGAFLKGAVTLRIRATDDAEATPTVSFVGLTDTDQGASVAVAVLDTRLANGGTDGPISVMAVARDAAGNERRDTRTFEADNTAPTVAVLPAGFYVESASGTWWTGAGEPNLSGSLGELHPRSVEILIAGEVVATATIDGATWSARLPTGKVTRGGNEVVVRATDLAGNVATTTAVQLRLDDTPPGVLVESSPVFDELNSTLFYDLDNTATNTWLQRHVTGGAPIDLAQSMNGSCTTVHKFSHLLHESFVLGSTGNLNPLKASFVVSDDGVGIEPGTSQARLTIRNGSMTTEALPWTAIPGAGIAPKTTRHLLGLYRDGAFAIPALATTEGEYHLELRARDKLGRISLLERCWNHRILAPTLRPNDPAAGQKVMFPTSLQSSASFSAAFLNASAAGDAMWIRRVRNYLGTPVFLHVTITQGVDAQVSRTFVVRNALANPRVVSVICGANPCNIVQPTEVIVSPPAQPHANLKLRARLFLMNGSQLGPEILPCPGCANDDDAQSYTFEIPARATPQGAPLAEYAIVTHLRPTLPAGGGTDVLMAPRNSDYPDSGPYGEFLFNGVQLTGRANPPGAEVCTAQEEDAEFNRWICVEHATRQTYRALKSVTYTMTNQLVTAYREGATSTLITGVLAEGEIPGGTVWSTTEPTLP
jgi:hypothetical protein